MPTVALVTGARGFAGRHLVEHLKAAGDDVHAPAREEVDLRDRAATRELIAGIEPQTVYHLAALASVGRSWESPSEALLDNQAMTLNVLETVRLHAPGARVLLASSGEVYGRPSELPVTEAAPLSPQSPYAVAKVGSDLLGGLYSDAWGVHVVRTRAFNHAGPGQADTYVIASLTRQVAEAEAAGKPAVRLRTGNPDAARDFTDVRDVVRAYRLATTLDPGAYNVASGSATAVRDLVRLVQRQTEVEVRHEVDPERVRDHEVQEIRGSADRLRAATGWEPEIPLETTIADALGHWRRALG